MIKEKQLTNRSRYGLSAPIPFTIILGLAASALVAFASNQTWARVTAEPYVGEEITRMSIRGNIGDGEVTFVLSIAAVVLVLYRLIRPNTTGFVLMAAATVLLVSAITGMLNWVDVDHIPGVFKPGEYFRTGVTVGWGLLTVTFASAVGMAVLAYQLWYDELR